jgi:hypothetical protein
MRETATCSRYDGCMGSSIDALQEHIDGRQPLRRMLGILIVACAAFALVMAIAMTRQAIALANPLTLSVASGGAVWVSSHDHLHRFDTTGRRELRLAPAELKLPLPLRHLYALSAHRLLVSAGEPSRIYRGDADAKSCVVADAGYVAKFGEIVKSAWIGADAEGKRVVIADSAAHRLAVIDESGQVLAAQGGAIGRFHYPGQVVWAGADEFWLAAGDRFRIERIAFDGRVIGEPAQELALSRNDGVLAGRNRPMALAPLPDGRWWVVVKPHFTKAGGLVLVDPAQGRVVQSAALAAEADIAAVATMGDSMLLADLNGPALRRMSLDGQQVSTFGDASFMHELQDRESRREQAQHAVRWSQGLTIGLPLVGIVLLLVLGERMPTGPRKLQATGPASLVNLPMQLRLLPGVRRSLRILAWLGLSLIVTTVVMFVFALAPQWRAFFDSPAEAADKARWLFIVVAAILLAAIFASVYVFRALMRESSAALTIEAQRLTLHHDTVLKASAAWDDCRTDGRVLFIGLQMVALAWQRGTRFEEAALKQRLLPMLPAHNWYSGFGLYRVMLNLYWQRAPLRVLMVGSLLLCPVALELSRGWGVLPF